MTLGRQGVLGDTIVLSYRVVFVRAPRYHREWDFDYIQFRCLYLDSSGHKGAFLVGP